MENGLWAWEASEGSFEMTTKGSDVLKIWAWFQQSDIDPNKGGDFIISDG
jgi:hypothetical protein